MVFILAPSNVADDLLGRVGDECFKFVLDHSALPLTLPNPNGGLSCKLIPVDTLSAEWGLGIGVTDALHVSFAQLRARRGGVGQRKRSSAPGSSAGGGAVAAPDLAGVRTKRSPLASASRQSATSPSSYQYFETP